MGHKDHRAFPWRLLGSNKIQILAVKVITSYVKHLKNLFDWPVECRQNHRKSLIKIMIMDKKNRSRGTNIIQVKPRVRVHHTIKGEHMYNTCRTYWWSFNSVTGITKPQPPLQNVLHCDKNDCSDSAMHIHFSGSYLTTAVDESPTPVPHYNALICRQRETVLKLCQKEAKHPLYHSI